MTNTPASKPLLYAHIGDLHITNFRAQNYTDLLSILSQIEINGKHLLDFVVLPGDNADNGLPSQYRLVATALKMLSMPVHILSGDHDMEQKSLYNFYHTLSSQKLPFAISVCGYRCLFLDVCGPGKGGPDFRLGTQQLTWLKDTLSAAGELNEPIVIFMHTYPADLKDEQEKQSLNELTAAHNVLLVDMGHTHYNELSNDGHTIFAATRSTGQIEEGAVGYSIISLHNNIVSWRFKSLYEAFPFVLITTPADYRLARDTGVPRQDMITVTAVVLGEAAVQSVHCTLNNSAARHKMTYNPATLCWECSLPVPFQEQFSILVEAVDESGRPGRHQIQIAGLLYTPTKHIKDGSDADRIDYWPENAITGTQLGPNRNAPSAS